MYAECQIGVRLVVLAQSRPSHLNRPLSLVGSSPAMAMIVAGRQADSKYVSYVGGQSTGQTGYILDLEALPMVTIAPVRLCNVTCSRASAPTRVVSTRKVA